MEKEKQNEHSKILKAGALVLQVSLSAICPIILLLSLGVYLDNKYHPGNHLFAIIGIICGVYSAYRSTYYLIKDALKLKNDDK